MSDLGEQSCANPLFLKWVSEWHDDARKRNAKSQYTLKKAQASLQRYPLPITNPQDTVQLQGIGQGIADRLAKKLSSWRKEQGIPDPQSDAACLNTGAQETGAASQSQAQRAPRIYVPRYRSGAFALLIGLLKTYCLYGPDYYIPKNQLIPLCEQYSSTPFSVPGGGGGGGGHRGGSGFSQQQYTAWSGMKTLETKSLVERQGGVKFCLTDEGLEIARKVADVLRVRNELPPDDKQIIAAYECRREQGQAGGGSEQGSVQEEVDDPLAYSSEGDTEEVSLGRHLPPPMPGTTATGVSRGARRVRGPSSSGAAAASTADFSDLRNVYLSSAANPAPLSRNQSAGGASYRSSSPAIPFSRQSSPAVSAEIELTDLIHYPANEYDIILVVDNREVHSVVDRNLIGRELEDKSVKIEIRPLTVGDYLWIARAKPTSAYRHLPDIVLDYVVERKRMDDLCASIRDGRYREQHARIHSTGFTNVFYIVEGNDPEAVSRLGEGAVNTAMSRIQVHHGFHLKRTVSFDASLKLLRQTTSALQNSLGDVYAIPDQFVGQKAFAKMKRRIQARFPQKSLAMTFEAYDVVSSKSGTLSVGEIYLRMLMTLRGISADKALSIGQMYPTPLQLVDALTKAPDGSRALEDLVVDTTRRRLGPTMAKKLAQFWTGATFSTT
ncbi:ERCC4-domain-containing protein [Martensiomyces pterosporus]|nr:ERCC4-domain-containing protein [Martensiomyces pterosporus]